MNRFITVVASVASALSLFAGTPASFPGGSDKLYEYLQNNVKYPAFAQENGIEGTVTVDFMVADDGRISAVKIARPLDPDLEAEAIRVVKSMPAWQPAIDDNGNPVSSPVSLPVKFRLAH